MVFPVKRRLFYQRHPLPATKWPLKVAIYVCLNILLTPATCITTVKPNNYLRFDSITVGALMDSLSNRFNYNFAWDAGLLEADSVVNVNIPLGSTDLWINNFFTGKGASVQFLGNQVIIGRSRIMPGQNRPLRVSGQVVDPGTRSPVGMVNITVEGEPTGTVSNDKGLFNLNLPKTFAGKTLNFSFLGYQATRLTIPAGDTTLVVNLQKRSIPLQEVVIPYRNPAEIILQMITNVPSNYPGSSSILTAFFRETVQQDNRYVDVSEAIIEILKPTYHNLIEREQVRFIRGRKGSDLSEMSLVNLRLVGGPYNFSRLDVARYRDFFPAPGEESLFTYTFEGLGFEHDRMVYKVGFKPVNDVTGLVYQGELRVDSKSYALVSATFQLTPRSLRRSRDYLVKRDSRRFRARPFFARYTVNYRPWNNTWVLSSVTGELNLRVVDKDNRIRTTFSTVSELLVSDIELLEPGARVRWSDTFDPSYVLSENLGEFDDYFWRDYNILKPGEALERAFNPGK